MRKYQCFISSTYEDLRDERAMCIEAVLEAQHIPAGMEYFEVGRPQREIIEQWISQSDMVIFIIGGRYGTIDKQTGHGYLEDEFDYVIKNEIPHFIIMLSEVYLAEKNRRFLQENVKLSVNEKERIKQTKYKKFVEKICKDEMVAYVNQLADIRTEVMRNIQAMIQNRRVKGGWVEYQENMFENVLAVDWKKVKSETKENMFRELLKDKLVDKADRENVQEISNIFCDILSQYDNSLDNYISTMSRTVEITLYDAYIEVKNSISITYQKIQGMEYSFEYNPWLYEGLESESFKLYGVKYNGKEVEGSCIKKGTTHSTSNPFYVTDIVKLSIPFDLNQQQHRVQYRTCYKTDYDRYFHEYIFREFCHFFNLAVSLKDMRIDKKEKEYMLRWGLFTPYKSMDYSSKNILNHEKDQLNFNVYNLMIPGNGYFLTLNSAPFGIIKKAENISDSM